MYALTLLSFVVQHMRLTEGGFSSFRQLIPLGCNRKCLPDDRKTEIFVGKYPNYLFLNFIFDRAINVYLCLYNQLFAIFHYVFKSLKP